jgi:DNA polymerase elongation subunit (family B)
MYQNIYIEKSQHGKPIVHLWDDKKGYEKFQFTPYAYQKSPTGQHRSLYGDKLKKIKFWTGEDLQKGDIFESDVPLETRVLIDKYGDSNEPSEGHRELFFDIEVEVVDGFPEPKTAKNKITAIALYDKTADSYHCFVLGNVKNTDVVEAFRTEEELLQRFYQKYLEINPTILSGWNIDGFDIPYLYNRTKKVMGEQIANCLSPINNVYYNEHQNKYKIAGVSQLDYLALYRLYTYTQQSSYRLDYIGKIEVGMGKIEYEGTLDDLYKSDINKYIEYNLNDVKIVKALDDKLKFIELARGVCHLGHIGYEDIFFSSRYLEGAMLVYMKDIGVVAPNKPQRGGSYGSEEKFAGAYVKDPKPGRYDWVFDLDLTSMYPSTIMTLNISPETKLGKLEGWNAEEFVKGVNKTYTLMVGDKEKGKYDQDELKKMFDNNKVSISSNGVMYHYDKKGLIPVLLEKWFNERVEFRRLMKQHADEGDMERSGYFNRRQHIQKIVLNSLYGVLGLPVFRFYDVDNAEATTLTGQDLIKFTEKIANYYYNQQLGDKEDYCIYTDTDSVFYPAKPLVKNKYPNADLDDEEFMTTQILEVAREVQDYINKSYDVFASRMLNVKGNHRFDIKQECIAKSAFWVTKKRYGQWIINDGGVKCDKVDVKGLDIVRSNFPPAMRDLMKEVLKGILSNVDKDILDEKIIDFKKTMKTKSIYDMALPTGVSRLSKFIDKRHNNKKIYGDGTIFTDTHKGTPVHVKAAIKYNDLLKHFGADNNEPIRNKEKIRWAYMKKNPLGIDALAFKGYDDPKQITDFIQQYMDYDRLFVGALQKKIKMFYEALSWDMPVDKINTLDRFF